MKQDTQIRSRTGKSAMSPKNMEKKMSIGKGTFVTKEEAERIKATHKERVKALLQWINTKGQSQEA